MADKKISALTGATTPLAGTEVLPIVQSGSTVKVAVSDLTAGRAISATQITLSTGNVIVANGQGMDFSATPGTGTSELFADYEEGTWTPTDQSGAGLSLTVTGTSTYIKVGRTCTVTTYVTWPATASVLDAVIGGLPFTAAAIGNTQGLKPNDTSVTTPFMAFIITSLSNNIYFPKFGGIYLTNLDLSAKYIRFSGTYITT
jgi:hypothetical protein